MNQRAEPTAAERAAGRGWRMRTGHTLGRTIYLLNPFGGGKEQDICIGMVDSPELAEEIARRWNRSGDE